MSRVGCIIQARLGSERLPYKVLREIHGKIVLYHVLDAAWQAGCPDTIVLTTPDRAICDLFSYWCSQQEPLSCNSRKKTLRHQLWEGQRDPLAEYHRAAIEHSLDLIVRITADCPMLIPQAVDDTIKAHINQRGRYAYTYNGKDGSDVEVFEFSALHQAWRNSDASDHEHVCGWILRHRPCQYLRPFPGKYKSLDTLEDLEWIRANMAKVVK